MKALLLSFVLAITLTGGSIYDFKVPGLEGGEIDFKKFKGKKILIVNTASKCGNTPQYTDLQKLYETYSDKVVVVGFPANNFKGQEPGSAVEIAEFCKKNYGVTFPMAEKVSVKGDDIHPLFKWLVEESQALARGVSEEDQSRKKFLEDPIQWNFTKFLLDEKGKLIMPIHHRTSVMSDDVLKYIK
jgi:glutathione peroxidase